MPPLSLLKPHRLTIKTLTHIFSFHYRYSINLVPKATLLFHLRRQHLPNLDNGFIGLIDSYVSVHPEQ